MTAKLEKLTAEAQKRFENGEIYVTETAGVLWLRTKERSFAILGTIDAPVNYLKKRIREEAESR